MRIKLYGFAEKYCIKELANYLVTNIISVCGHYNEIPNAQEMVLAYKCTNSQRSPLRLLMVNFLQFVIEKEHGGSPWSAQLLSEGLSQDSEILKDFILLLRRKGVTLRILVSSLHANTTHMQRKRSARSRELFYEGITRRSITFWQTLLCLDFEGYRNSRREGMGAVILDLGFLDENLHPRATYRLWKYS